MRSTWKMLKANSCPATRKVTSWTSSPVVVVVIGSALPAPRGRGSAPDPPCAPPRPRQRFALGQRQGGTTDYFIRVVYFERDVAAGQLDQHRRAAAFVNDPATT